MMALCEIGTMKEATLGKRMKRLEGQKRRKKKPHLDEEISRRILSISC